MLFIATLAWGLRKISRAITLALILILALKPGFVHAVYGMLFSFETRFVFLPVNCIKVPIVSSSKLYDLHIHRLEEKVFP